MGLRFYIVKLLIKFSEWLRYLSIIILSPEEILNFAKIYYKRKADNYSKEYEDDIKSGLNKFEKEILEKHFQNKKAKILLLGCGGGRESIALAKLGFHVTGVDMVEEAISIAENIAEKERVQIDFVCNEFSELSLPYDSFDYAFFSLWLYEQIPSMKKRVEIVRSLKMILKNEGKVIFHFHLSNLSPNEKRLYPFHKAIAWITWGNRGYQLGDRPAHGIHLYHIFTTKEEIHNELIKAGFSSTEFTLFDKGWGGYVIATP